MYDSVMNTFQTQSAFLHEDKEETQKKAEEMLLKSLHKDHPKVKDCI